MGKTSLAVLAVACAAAARGIETFSDSIDDVGDADVFQRVTESITAPGPAHAYHQSRPLEIAEKLLEVACEMP